MTNGAVERVRQSEALSAASHDIDFPTNLAAP